MGQLTCASAACCGSALNNLLRVDSVGECRMPNAEPLLWTARELLVVLRLVVAFVAARLSETPKGKKALRAALCTARAVACASRNCRIGRRCGATKPRASGQLMCASAACCGSALNNSLRGDSVGECRMPNAETLLWAARELLAVLRLVLAFVAARPQANSNGQPAFLAADDLLKCSRPAVTPKKHCVVKS